ncbi:hypothetical protein IE53DRAFT_389403 [Violaceomyces palustris]|uniref:Uncharacterized protein n=1 Tax=Violaceomyces palustris TaxID=1673888 RepID=A0ACD0NRG3_9BASI|nr:hypothetical protein IE53DRAFT_389403 [Violaceomyces palustris]
MSESIYAPQNQAARQQEQHPNLTNDHDHDDQSRPLPTNPYLNTPLLFISCVQPSISDKQLASTVFEKSLPVRIKIDRQVDAGKTASGTVEFQTLEKAECAYATVREPIRLCLTEQESQEPKPNARPRLIKQLPPYTDDAMIFNLFRPFGPLAKAHRILTSPTGQHTGFRGMGLVEFFDEKDAQKAQDEMHCAEVGGKTISVAVDTIQRRPVGVADLGLPSTQILAPQPMSANAPAFSPTPRSVSGGSAASIYATAQPTSSNGGQHQAVGNLQYSASNDVYIDPCNLFCKNLDPSLDSNDLFSAFKKFGRIVSARVMRDNEGKSREFGFVSFTTADEASRALQAMNNRMVNGKPMIVRLHEPKKMRSEKLAARFAGAAGGGVSDNSGAASPVVGEGNASEAYESMPGTPLVSSGPTVKSSERRQSNSFYKAAVANDSGVVDEEQLSAMSSVMRREVLCGEFARRLKGLPTIEPNQVEGLVEELVKLRLADAVDALSNHEVLLQRVNEASDTLPQSPIQHHSSIGGGGNGFLSAPLQKSGSGQSSADNISILSSAPASSKERGRILKAVKTIVAPGGPVEDITDMLTSLPRKERALCLFNPDVLRQKVEEAREILEMTSADEEEEQEEQGHDGVKHAPLSKSTAEATSSGPASGSSSEQKQGKTKEASEEQEHPPIQHTLSSLSKLPALEIIQLANTPCNPGSPGLPLPKPDPSVVARTDEFIDSLQGKPTHDQKQKLGDQLFKKVRALGIKGAPKITIQLLDTEDLRSLAHIMNEYEDVLREKVNHLVVGSAKVK